MPTQTILSGHFLLVILFYFITNLGDSMTVVSVMLGDGQHVKLGRIRPKSRPQCLNLANYFDASALASPPPAVVDWTSKAMPALKRMYLNDQYGDCVIAGKYHQVGLWSGNSAGTAVQGTDKEVYASYQKICGPGDNGCMITAVLDYFKNTGLPFNGQVHKIDGYVTADWTNKLLVQIGILLFGGGTIGINLPQAWTCSNCIWDTTNSQIVGGHDVCLVGYNEQGVQICTWGGIVTITWNAFLSRKWIEELYFELGQDWYKGNLAPNGIDVDKLKRDLSVIGGGGIPPLDDPTPPPVPPVPPTPPVPGTGFTGAVRYSYTNGVVSDISLFKPKH